MKKEYAELARYRLQKAKNTLADANLFFSKATSETIVNRIYYALFYSVNALLITEGKYSSKHSGVRSIFNRDFVKSGIVNIELGKFYSEMFDSRQEGDYRDFVEFRKNDIERYLKKAEEFISMIETIIIDRLKETNF